MPGSCRDTSTVCSSLALPGNYPAAPSPRSDDVPPWRGKRGTLLVSWDEVRRMRMWWNPDLLDLDWLPTDETTDSNLPLAKSRRRPRSRSSALLFDQPWTCWFHARNKDQTSLPACTELRLPSACSGRYGPHRHDEKLKPRAKGRFALASLPKSGSWRRPLQ